MSMKVDRKWKPLYRYLDLTGDGTGAKDAAVDGSVTPVKFKIQPPAGRHFILHRLLVYIECSRVGFSADTYGNVAKLANGVLVRIHNANDDAVVTDLTDGIGVDHNSHWRSLCFDSEPDEYGNGDRAVGVRWTFSKSGQPLSLLDHEYFAVTIQDDLTGLDEQLFMVQGMWK